MLKNSKAAEKMIHYGLTPIEKDKVILKPYLLK